MKTDMMQAVYIEQYGGPDMVLHGERPIPVAGPGDVLVRVACAGINFMDVHTRQGKYAQSATYPVRLPCTLGMEGAGVVVAIGAGVTRLAVGDRVAWCIAWGSYAAYACVPERLTARLPDAIGFDMAAAAMFQGCTAHYLLHDVAAIKPGATCLVHAASGSIGQLLVQLGRQAGATVFATASSPAKIEVARRLGADHAMPYDDGESGGGFADRIRALTGGAGVDVVFDAVGRSTLRESLRATRRRGLVVNYGAVSGAITDLDPLELGEAGSLFLTRPRLADHMADAATVQGRADAIFNAILKGELAIDIAGRYTLDEVGQVHARLEQRQQIGKAIVLCQDA